MNVLYDISVLGLGQWKRAWRVGIFRVVENLACQLAQSKECRLTLTAVSYQLHAKRYVAAQGCLSGIPLQYIPYKGYLHTKRAEAVDAIGLNPTLRKLPLRVWQKALDCTAKAVGVDTTPLSAKLLGNTDVFHTTHFPLPVQTKKLKNVKCVETVYDLIPILHPEFYGGGDVTQTHAYHVIQSIGPKDWVVAISQATKDDLCEYTGMDPERVFVTPLAADPQMFYPCTASGRIAETRTRYGIPEGPYVLSVCTLEPRKNLAHVVRSFIRLLREQRFSDLSLVLAGGKGWLTEGLFAELAGEDAAALRERIIVTGYVDDADLSPLYSGALCFVYPSLYEGFGLPPLEAMQCGIPVITSNTSSLPEVVGDAGILLDPHDQNGLCQALLNLYENGELRETMSVKSLARASQFSWRRCAEDTLRAYRAAQAS